MEIPTREQHSVTDYGRIKLLHQEIRMMENGSIEKDMAKLGLWTNPYKCTEADYYGEIDNGWLNNNPKLVKNPYQ